MLSTSGTEFKQATTTPLVENFFGHLFNELRSTRREPNNDTRKAKVETKKPAEKLGNEKKPDDGLAKSKTENIDSDVKTHVKLSRLENVEQYEYRGPNTKVHDALRNMGKGLVKRKFNGSDEKEECSMKKARKVVSDDTVVWQSEAEEIDNRTYYRCAQVGDEFITVGNFVRLRHGFRIGLIKYMYEDDEGKTVGHFQRFVRSRATILSDEGVKQELFLTDECEDIALMYVKHLVDVERLHRYISVDDWRNHGAETIPQWLQTNSNTRNKYFYQKRYRANDGSFVDLPDDEDVPNICANCSRKTEFKIRDISLPIGEMVYDEKTREYTIKKVRWRDEYFTVGSSVFLLPSALIEPKTVATESPAEEQYDENEYPEKYRKKLTNDENPREDPFDVGFISRIFTKKRNVRHSSDVRIELKIFYRPQNTHLEQEVTDREDLNKLYWSDEDCVSSFDQVQGKCFVSYEKNLEMNVDEWREAGPFRFYFAQAYDPETKVFTEPPSYAKNIGQFNGDNVNVPYDHPANVQPLAMMDVFAGCGGLSDGLCESGVAECRWAIEKFSAPAEAFKLNHRKATVFQQDCNDLLRDIMRPKANEKRKLPKRGEVDLLCGGPPCQGFSELNRFKNNIPSKFTNSLITTYLSYCDHFRPRFFIMENVRGFVSTYKGVVFKSVISCLVRMGYQVRFGILQCGRYGIPQCRRRTIILAAAPGEILPKFPEPTHTFPLSSYLDISIGGKKYKNENRWAKSAPYRTITVNDAISDLPKIKNNSEKYIMHYKKEPQTHFQKVMRGAHSKADDKLRDHVCKKLGPLILERIKYIPRDPPGDWRDLPNKEIRLSNGTLVTKLKYTHHDTSKGQQRGVCACITSRTIRCTRNTKQKETLIPWTLAHTSHKHNQWSDSYGRVPKNSYFRTIVTNPRPMSQQGRLLHPDQNRIVSIRECARSQGFKDSFRFYGECLDKYAQIGNAVAPPLAKAIGLELRKSVAAKIAADGADNFF